ncbi:ribbon-helix-helix protein, CopG family [Limosilactobacillus reuteri]|nr:ribbon-helix-helix protein, CopG family [Limosilactobacillus reuteri]MCC4438179.1 ribbon-helix-helix protein, CopG family [Limosilactobacillus reuteri]MCC4442631.1 ribbon-helix-helix protein, CopG family [Limosilactobacillus reuteri]MCC4444247.1 ribbon-helix-helix protein, CopG family [Limosilactobacillus reuteri]MCC4445933.1 ribbon-helix-helix protein, CopG family [Limosilactobacillus reuteri]
MKCFTLRISENLDASINSLANKQEINKTQLIRKILQEYVERRK